MHTHQLWIGGPLFLASSSVGSNQSPPGAFLGSSLITGVVLVRSRPLLLLLIRMLVEGVREKAKGIRVVVVVEVE